MSDETRHTSQGPNPPAFEDVLENCLIAMREGTTIEDCVARYPAHADDLRPALHTAALTRHLPAPTLPDDRVDALENRLLAYYDDQQAQRRVVAMPARQWAGKWAAALALVFFLALGAGGTTVAASASSMPGDPLYDVKRGWEDVITFIMGLLGRLGDVWLHLAQVRYEEFVYAVEQNQPSDVALIDFYDALLTAVLLSEDDSADLVAFMDATGTTFAPLADNLVGETARLYAGRVQRLLQPVYDDAGRLQVPLSLEQVPDAVPAAATATATLTPTPTATLTVTASPTASLTATATTTPGDRQATEPPPPTATRTASPTATPTLTVTATPAVPSATPTFTLTPLPLPGEQTRTAPSATPRPLIPPPVTNPTATPDVANSTPFWVRQTQAAVYATQTAIAEGSGD